jgi:hypothetical protein
MYDANEETLTTLKEILKWTRIQAIPGVRTTLESTLAKPEYRKLYQALDGKKTQAQLVQACGISQPRISQLITGWQRMGIVEEASPGKYTKSFDLENLGIEIG